MNIIVVGCGKVGMTIVEQISGENHDITVIERNSKKVELVASKYDVIGVTGDGASYSVQMEAGVEEADLLIAVTGSDELNLLCCLFAKKAGNCKTIARVRNPIYNKDIHYIKEELGLSMVINPEFAAATEIARLLRFPSATKVDTFAKGRAEMVHFRVLPEHKICNLSLSEVRSRFKYDILVCAVEREGEVIIPGGNFVVHAEDILSIIANPLNTNNFLERIGADTHKVKDVMVIGGGKITYYLALQIQNMGIKMRIIENNISRCEELSENFPKALIIHGDGTDKELLMEEGLAKTEAFVPLTDIDEENILLALYAKRESKAKSIVKINNATFNEVFQELDAGRVIDPKRITANRIIKYVRSMRNHQSEDQIVTLCKIINDQAEAIEFLVEADCPLIGRKIKAMELKKNLLIGCITRKAKAFIPSGDDCFEAGDSVVIVTINNRLERITDILR